MSPYPNDGGKLASLDTSNINFRILLKLAWPVAFSVLLAQLPVVVDIFWIGKLSSAELASAGVCASIFSVAIAISQLLSAGVMAFVARYAGANERDKVQGAIFHGLFIALVMSAVLTAFGFLLSQPLLFALSATQNVAYAGLGYLRILFFALPFIYLSAVTNTALNATGDTFSPMLVALGVNLLNLLLDPLFIFGWLGFPKLGIVGAGAATLFAWIFNLVISLFILNKKRLFAFVPLSIRFIWAFLKVGFFAMIQGITRPVTGMIMMLIVGFSGQFAQAAFGVGLRIISISFIFVNGLTIATQALVGQSLGARNEKAALKTVRLSILSALIVQSIFALLFFVAAAWIMGIFSPGKVEVITIGAQYLRVLAPFMLIMPFGSAWSGAQYGAGKTKGPAMAALVANLLVKLPLAFILSRLTPMDTSGVWLAIGISVAVEVVITGIFYLKGNWKRSVL